MKQIEAKMQNQYANESPLPCQRFSVCICLRDDGRHQIILDDFPNKGQKLKFIVDFPKGFSQSTHDDITAAVYAQQIPQFAGKTLHFVGSLGQPITNPTQINSLEVLDAPVEKYRDTQHFNYRYLRCEQEYDFNNVYRLKSCNECPTTQAEEYNESCAKNHWNFNRVVKITLSPADQYDNQTVYKPPVGHVILNFEGLRKYLLTLEKFRGTTIEPIMHDSYDLCGIRVKTAK